MSVLQYSNLILHEADVRITEQTQDLHDFIIILHVLWSCSIIFFDLITILYIGQYLL
jgi:hypothetical protein